MRLTLHERAALVAAAELRNEGHDWIQGSALAARMGTSSYGAHQTAASLVRKGLAQKRTDRRIVVIALTEAGLAASGVAPGKAFSEMRYMHDKQRGRHSR